ncbi:MAG: carbohydrate kinase family protein [Candidatus Hydrogenedentes bacterium]|nr:carbohydrate kinase family protein [Candidatus Hydrogenedentota bacterium]
MSRPFDVMAAGHVCLDLIPRFPNTGATELGAILRPGKLVEMGPVTISTGGPVSNTGIALRRLGRSVCFSARVGDDEFGRLTLDALRRSGNADGIHVVPGSASSYTVALAPPGIDRVFLHNPGTNHEFGSEDVDCGLVGQCRMFHFGYPPLMRRMYENVGEELERTFRLAKEAGATTSCDMSLPDPDSAAGKAPWKAILERTLPCVDVFLPSVEEALYMLEVDRFLQMKRDHGGAELIDVLTAADYTRLADALLAMGPAIVALKSGHRGFYVKTSAREAFDRMGAASPHDADAWSLRELWGPAFSAPDLASATGSGDSSIAGFLTAFLNGYDIEESLRTANCLGWQNVQALDAVSGIRTWEETCALLERPAPVNDVRPGAAGWVWHEERGVWAGPEDALNA